uniref:Uncharacterized protein n=1 Tax=Rheinheimera sp. BAL341 TaxID=1708203 RepID=A0A486XKH7_9GAMM
MLLGGVIYKCFYHHFDQLLVKMTLANGYCDILPAGSNKWVIKSLFSIILIDVNWLSYC